MHRDSYSCFRICTCVAGTAAIYGVGALAGLVYACVGGKSRTEEATKTRLLLTKSAVYFDSYFYTCGCCCYSQKRKMVPLEKIQDVALEANCCADCCGYTPPGTTHFKLAIQTAGNSGGGEKSSAPEVVVVALADPDAFRAAVLSARRILLGRGNEEDHARLPTLVGDGKEQAVAIDSSMHGYAPAGSASGAATSDAPVLALLERMNGLLERVATNLESTGESKA